MAEPTLSAEDFAQRYAEGSGVTVEWLKAQGRRVLLCDCGARGCEGWQMVRPESVGMFNSPAPKSERDDDGS